MKTWESCPHSTWHKHAQSPTSKSNEELFFSSLAPGSVGLQAPYAMDVHIHLFDRNIGAVDYKEL